MVLIMLLGAVVLVAFGVVGWIFFSTKKESEADKQDTAVPINDLSELKSVPKISTGTPVFVEEPLAQDTPPALPEKDDFPPKAVDVEKSAETEDSLTETEVRRHEEQVLQLREEVRLIREKAVIQAKNAIEVINKLREQTDQLRAENQKLVQDTAGLREKDEAIAQFKAAKISSQEEFQAALQAAEQANRKLAEQVTSLDQTVEQLRAENAAFKNTSLSADEERVRLTATIRAEYQDRLEGLSARLEALRLENETLLSRSVEAAPSPAEGFVSADEVSSLQKATDILREEKEGLEARVRELEVQNAGQVEKNGFLQYELTKSRAQAMGLERIYENSRKQIEGLSRQVSDTRMDNKELKKQADVLEQSLNDFKRLNNEILKRETLSQFEIEKSRGDLRDLERIYNGFRSRLMQVGMD